MERKQQKRKGKGKAYIIQVNKDAIKCFSYKKKRHIKKAWPKYKTWLKKKGNNISLVYYESNMVHVFQNTWWIDSGSTIYVANTMYGFLNQRKLMNGECVIYSMTRCFLMWKL